MDPILKEKWVKALRSGEYKQYRGGICSAVHYGVVHDSSYCCIGVGHIVANNGEWRDADTYSAAEESLGLSATQADVLVGLNDEQKKSFAEIADYIEEHL